MKFVYDDGGRSKYYKAGEVGDCVCRAISIATGRDYKEVHDLINEFAKSERRSTNRYGRVRGKSSARNGVRKATTRKVLESLGFVWTPTMQIGQGCKVHLREDELPAGTIIVSVSHHLTCVIDGVIHDTYDPTRDGERCVYGYYRKE